jgi:hypothetical protein
MSSISVFESVAISAMAYGGWMGVGMLPYFWTATKNPQMRLVLTLLVPTSTACLLTAIVSLIFSVSQIVYVVAKAMVTPKVLESATALLAIGVITASVLLTIRSHLKEEKYVGNAAEVSSSDSDSDSDASSDASEATEAIEEAEATEEEVTEDEVAEATEEEAEEEIDSVEAEKILNRNLDVLRNAPPLPESDAE